FTQLLQRGQQTRHIKRFVANPVGALAHRLFDAFVHLAAMPGDKHGPCFWVRLANDAKYRSAVAGGKFHVDKDDLEVAPLEPLGRLPFTVSETNAETPIAQNVPQGRTEVVIVIYDHDERLAQCF